MVTSFRSYAPSYFKHFYIPNYDKWNNLILCWAGTISVYYCIFGVRNGYSFYPIAGVRGFDIFLYQRWPWFTLNYINKFNVHIARNYSTLATERRSDHETFKLDPNWVTGFVDGEGCFHVEVIKNKKNANWMSNKAKFPHKTTPKGSTCSRQNLQILKGWSHL